MGSVLTIASIEQIFVSPSMMSGYGKAKMTHLVSVTPRKRLGSDVHVWILHPVLQRWHVFPMFPMLIPQVLSIQGCQQDCRYDNTSVDQQQLFLPWGLGVRIILNAELPPKI